MLTIDFRYYKSLNHLAELLEKHHHGIILVDEHATIVYANQSFKSIAGYSEQEWVQQGHGAKLRDVITSNIPLTEWLQQLSDSGVTEDNNETSNTQEAGFSSIEVRVFNKQRNALTSICYGVCVEIEDQIYTILHLFNLVPWRGLNLLQRFAGTFLKDVNLGVILVDTDFKVIDISDTACIVLGVKRDDVLNKSLDEVFASVPKEHQLVQRTILDGLVVRNHAMSWTNHDNRYELLMDSNLLKDEQGESVGAYIIFKDVTNLRSLEEQVQRSDRLAMIGQIAAGTAHEIRNPLTSIKGFMQVMKKSLYEKGMQKEGGFTDIILTEIDRINELVSEFLLLSKPKNITYSSLDITTVLRELFPIIHNEGILHSVTVDYQSSGNLPKVVGDRELFKQVCLNICKNGIEAMSEGGQLTISDSVDHKERKVNVEIHDTGPGIPAFLVDKIFDPFFTTKENGTGLGLSVCQRIIHDLGGSIRVSSKGFGTTFTISIPFNES